MALLLFFWVLICAQLACAMPLQASNNQTSATLQIHVFNLGQADSQLIIFPSGFSILVDAGELSWNSRKNAAIVAEKIRELQGGSMHVDVGVISHLHVDHLGYVGYGGFYDLIENYGVTFSKLIDRDAGIYSGSDCDWDTVTEDDITWRNAGQVSGTSARWICYATNPKNKVYAMRQVALVNSKNQIDPPDSGATVTILGVDGVGVKRSNGQNVSGVHTDMYAPSENDYSISLLIQFGNFDYVTAGDSSGFYSGQYNDVESVIMTRVPTNTRVDLVSANHHGSDYSSNPAYCAKMSPVAVVISLGQDNQYGHPGQSVIDEWEKTSQIFMTTRGVSGVDLGKAIVLNDDIVIETNGSTFTVDGLYTYNTR